MTTSSLTHLLLDLDGTVLNTIPGIIQSVRYACTHHLDLRLTDDDIVSGIGTPLLAQMRTHWRRVNEGPVDSDMVDRLCMTYIEHNLSHHDETVCPYPDVVESLTRLNRQGIPLGIVTSKPHATARRGLKVCGLESLFDLIIGVDEVAQPKPHPEPILMALDRMNCAAENAMYVGDSPHDMYAGRRAGVMTGAALWGPFSRDALMPSTPDVWLANGASLEQLYRNVNS